MKELRGGGGMLNRVSVKYQIQCHSCLVILQEFKNLFTSQLPTVPRAECNDSNHDDNAEMIAIILIFIGIMATTILVLQLLSLQQILLQLLLLLKKKKTGEKIKLDLQLNTNNNVRTKINYAYQDQYQINY